MRLGKAQRHRPARQPGGGEGAPGREEGKDQVSPRKGACRGEYFSQEVSRKKEKGGGLIPLPRLGEGIRGKKERSSTFT